MTRRTGWAAMPRWVVVASIVVVGVFFSSVPDASAHAVLESSNPADQSVLASSPSKVTLTFC
jgi:methionine-rich copper-binding protein CopC